MDKKLIKNGYEIERRFLVKNLPNLENVEKKEIVQYYLNDNVTRIRRINDDYILTQKSGSGIIRTEIEYSISKDHFNSLKKSAIGYIMKTRYFIPLNDLTIELDIFEGELKGIIICEVEFKDTESMNNFTPPDWFSTEITLDKKLSNKSMSKNFKSALKHYNDLLAKNN